MQAKCAEKANQQARKETVRPGVVLTGLVHRIAGRFLCIPVAFCTASRLSVLVTARGGDTGYMRAVPVLGARMLMSDRFRAEQSQVGLTTCRL